MKILLVFLLIIVILVLLSSVLNTGSRIRTYKGPRHKTPFEVLGVGLGASRDEIKRAYYERVKSYHPDNVPHNLAQEFKDLAEERTKELNQAYETLLSRMEDA